MGKNDGVTSGKEVLAAVHSPAEDLKGKNNAEKGVKAETIHRTSDLKLEIFLDQTQGTALEDAKKIDEIKTRESVEKQKDAIDKLQFLSSLLLSQFYLAGLTPGHFKTFDQIGTFDDDPTIPQEVRLKFLRSLRGMNGVAWRKIHEIASSPQSSPDSPYQAFHSKWNDLQKKSLEIYKQSDALNTALFSPKQNVDTSEKPKKWYEKMAETVKSHPWMKLLLVAGAVGLSVKAASMAYNQSKPGGSKDAEKQDKKSFGLTGWLFEKLGGKSKILGFALLTLGSYLGLTKITEYIKKHFHLDDVNVKKLVEFLKNGKWSDAFSLLSEGKSDPEHKKVADELSQRLGKKISEATIQSLASQKYEDFSHWSSNVGDYFMDQASKIPFIGNLVDWHTSKEGRAEQQILKDFFKANEQQIKGLNLPADATVLLVLQKLLNLPITAPVNNSGTVASPPAGAPALSGVVGAAGTTVTPGASSPGSPGKTPENPSAPLASPEQSKKEKGQTAEVESGKLVEVDTNFLKDLQEEFKNQPNFSVFLKKHEANFWSDLWKHPGDFMKEMLDACNQDKVGMIVGGGKILLWNGTKLVVFTSWAVLANLANDLIQGKYQDAISHYVSDTAPFIAAFGIPSTAIGYYKEKTMMGALLHGVKGGARGLILPVTVADYSTRVAQRAYWKLSELRLENIEDKARFYGELLEKYDALEQAKSPGSGTYTEKALAKIRPERTTALRKEFLRRFVESFNELHKGDPNMSPLRAETKEEVTKVFDELGKFMKQQRAKIAGAPANPPPPTPGAPPVPPAPTVNPTGQPASAPSSAPSTAAVVEDPQFLGENVVSGDKEYRYKYKGEEIVVKHSEIDAKLKVIHDPKLSDAENWKRAYSVLCDEKLPGVQAARVAWEAKAPAFEGSKGRGDKLVHMYRYEKVLVSLTETEIQLKVDDLAKTDPAPDPANASKYPRGLEDPTFVQDNTNWSNAKRAQAVHLICEEQFGLPKEVTSDPNKPKFKFKGKEFSFPEAEIDAKVRTGMNRMEAVKELCYEYVLKGVTVQDVRLVNGEYEYKIGNEWMKADNPADPVKFKEIEAKFAEHLKGEGKSADFARLAHENSAMMKYFGAFEKVFGTAIAVKIFYDLWTAPDKTKAVAEAGAGLLTFWGGMQLTDKTIGNKIAHPLGRTVVSLLGGVAVAMGVTTPVAHLMEGYVKSIPGGYAASKEAAEFGEKLSVRIMARNVFGSLEKGMLRAGIEKGAVEFGFKGVSSVFEKRIGASFSQRILSFASKAGFQQVLKALGWKGATTAALLADDATVIGVLDDIIAVGLAAWMAKDIYDIYQAISQARDLEKELQKRNGQPIEHLKGVHRQDRYLLQSALEKKGKSIDNLGELSEAEFQDILDSLGGATIQLELKRKGFPGYEVWTLSNGKATGIAIKDDQYKTLLEMTEEDAAKLDQSVEEAGKKVEKKS